MPHFGRLDMSSASNVARSPATTVAGSSPYTYTAQSNGVAFVSGGTVSVIQYGSGASLTALGVISGAIPMRAGDTLRITWAITAPSITFIPS